eukprot:comp14826_c0_seq1/m.21743 comp14826_c0_seq1/g.21743  ORF comp14826_c0_seq1/g.21743 comp14826_c0_seq1/m.21743 type:complete len:242 (-) comp14826_c0_seq1:68-793(-)
MRIFFLLFVFSAVVFCDEKPGDSDDFNAADFFDKFEGEETVGQAEGAQDAGSELPVKHADVSIVSYFPGHTDGSLPTGESISVLANLHNGATEVFNFSAVYARLYDAASGYSIQNYTLKEYHVPVPVGEEATIVYKFTPHEQLEPGLYRLETIAFYMDMKGKYYAETFFNNTVSLTENGLFMDSKTFIGTLAVLGAVIFMILQSLKNKKQSKSVSASNSDDWLRDANFNTKNIKKDTKKRN